MVVFFWKVTESVHKFKMTIKNVLSIQLHSADSNKTSSCCPHRVMWASFKQLKLLFPNRALLCSIFLRFSFSPLFFLKPLLKVFFFCDPFSLLLLFSLPYVHFLFRILKLRFHFCAPIEHRADYTQLLTWQQRTETDKNFTHYLCFSPRFISKVFCIVLIICYQEIVKNCASSHLRGRRKKITGRLFIFLYCSPLSLSVCLYRIQYTVNMLRTP